MPPLVNTTILLHTGTKYIPMFGHLPTKEADATPWDILLVDLIGPYEIIR